MVTPPRIKKQERYARQLLRIYYRHRAQLAIFRIASEGLSQFGEPAKKKPVKIVSFYLRNGYIPLLF
jgi:hypothetical protein